MIRMAVFVGGIELGGAILLAVELGDPHWVNRGGALLAAIAAFLAIFEAAVEHRVRTYEVSKPLGEGMRSRAFRRGVLDLATRIREARFRRGFGELSKGKMRTVFWVSGIAVLGEILHGFGDLVFIAATNILRIGDQFVRTFLFDWPKW